MNAFKALHIDTQNQDGKEVEIDVDDLSHLTPRGGGKSGGHTPGGKTQVDKNGNAIYDGSKEMISGISIADDDTDPYRRKLK